MKDGNYLIFQIKKQYFHITNFFILFEDFKRIDLTAIPMAADTGPIGGNLSHEFIILAETGESKIYTDKRIFEVENAETKLEENFRKFEKKYEQFYQLRMINLIKTNLSSKFPKKIV